MRAGRKGKERKKERSGEAIKGTERNGKAVRTVRKGGKEGKDRW